MYFQLSMIRFPQCCSKYLIENFIEDNKMKDCSTGVNPFGDTNVLLVDKLSWRHCNYTTLKCGVVLIFEYGDEFHENTMKLAYREDRKSEKMDFDEYLEYKIKEWIKHNIHPKYIEIQKKEEKRELKKIPFF